MLTSNVYEICICDWYQYYKNRIYCVYCRLSYICHFWICCDWISDICADRTVFFDVLWYLFITEVSYFEIKLKYSLFVNIYVIVLVKTDNSAGNSPPLPLTHYSRLTPSSNGFNNHSPWRSTPGIGRSGLAAVGLTP